MKSSSHSHQNGFALLILVVILMGMGGLLIAGYTQGILKGVEVKRFEHNKRVLKEAKQALLQFAYNYPELDVTGAVNGPGRFPCADTDNDGLPNTAGACAVLGRLPWRQRNMNLSDLRDSDGQRLWYAVSNNFDTNTGGLAINSGTVGSITVRDQSGNVIYDGSANGIAAVIIAPGAITSRNGVSQDRSPGAEDPFDTVADVELGIINAANYLDLVVGVEDNANFTQDSPTDGFILGPVNSDSPDAVNDQFIIITVAEVIEVAEKAVLQAYRTSIYDYLKVAGACTGGTGGTTEAVCTTNGGTWIGVYPWLYNYDVANILELNGLFPADKNFNAEKTNEPDINSGSGRIPSMFDPYFNEVDTESIQSKISLDYSGADFLGNITYNQDFPVVTTGSWSFSDFIWDGTPTLGGPASLNLNIETAEPVTDLRFENNASVGIVDLIGTIAADESFSFGQSVIWFWRKDATDNWSKCTSTHLIDCHVNSGFTPDPHGPGLQSIEILKVDVADFLFDSSASDLIQFTFDVSSLTGPPGPLVNIAIAPADNNGHAQITATFGPGEFSTPLLTAITYEYDSDYTDADWNVEASGSLDFSSFPSASVNLGLRYYPELPEWAFNDLWHDSVMLSYALAYRPDNGGPCSEATDCIQLDSSAGNIDNKISILTIAGQNDWIDDGVAGFDDDLIDVFEGENATIANNIFDAKPTLGNDKILIVEECEVAACP